MKKDLIFAPILLVLGAALFFLRFTRMPAHIAISVVGVLALAAYTVLTRKEWKIKPLEIAMRAFYGVALISGVVMMAVHGVPAIAIAHKVAAVLFLVSIVVLLSSKAFATKKA